MSGNVTATKKVRKDVRLTERAQQIIDNASEKFGVGDSQVIEMALRKFAEVHGIIPLPKLSAPSSR